MHDVRLLAGTVVRSHPGSRTEAPVGAASSSWEEGGGDMVPGERLARRIVNPLSTGVTRWWCHSAFRRSVRRHRAARVATVRVPRVQILGRRPAKSAPPVDRTEVPL
jgi:hypothetical protein